MKKSYAEQLRDPRWQRKRLEILNRSNFTCEECGDHKSTLNVHHKRYHKGAAPWEYEGHELAALCERCHTDEHAIREALTAAMMRLSISDLTQLLGFADGLCLLAETVAAVKARDIDHAEGLAAAANKPGLMQVYEFLDEATKDHILTSDGIGKHRAARFAK